MITTCRRIGYAALPTQDDGCGPDALSIVEGSLRTPPNRDRVRKQTHELLVASAASPQSSAPLRRCWWKLRPRRGPRLRAHQSLPFRRLRPPAVAHLSQAVATTWPQEATTEAPQGACRLLRAPHSRKQRWRLQFVGLPVCRTPLHVPVCPTRRRMPLSPDTAATWTALAPRLRAAEATFAKRGTIQAPCGNGWKARL